MSLLLEGATRHEKGPLKQQMKRARKTFKKATHHHQKNGPGVPRVAKGGAGNHPKQPLAAGRLQICNCNV